MMRWAPFDTQGRLASITRLVAEQLDVVSHRLRSNLIQPFCHLNGTDESLVEAAVERPLRVGVFPIAANPLHWGHLIVGLTALASIPLDKVLYIVAGNDRRKPSMLAAAERHGMCRRILGTFNPLLAYSPLALGNDLDGETNFARLLAMNEQRAIHAFYLAGSDHCRRVAACGELDTVGKLERLVETRPGLGGTLHAVSAVFISRHGVVRKGLPRDSVLDLQLLPSAPLPFSSTAVREALEREELCSELFCVPYSCLREILRKGFYRRKPLP